MSVPAARPAVAVVTLDEIEALVRRVVREELGSAAPALDDLPLDSAQAAQVAGVRPKTIRRWVASGRLRATRQGQEIRATRADVLRAAAGGGTMDPGEVAAAHLSPLRRPA